MSITTTKQPSATPSNTPPVPQDDDAPTGFLARFRRDRSNDLTPEVLEFVSPTQAIVSRPPWLLARRTISIIATMALSIFVLMALIKIDRIATGSGKIVSLVPETVVQPAITGTVKTIAVSMGDIVRKGQLLAQLDPTVPVANNTAAKDQLDRYQTEVDRLTSEFHQAPYRPKQLTPGALVQEGIFAQRAAAREAELRYYKGQIDAQRALMVQGQANVQQYAKETGVAMDLEKIRTKLEADAVGSRVDTLSAISSRLEAERTVLFSIEQTENARQLIAALQGQLDNYNQQWFADVSQNLTDDAVQLAATRAQMEQAAMNLTEVDLRAQEDSIVLSVAPVSPGAVMSVGQTFFTLVPINAPLEVDTQVTADQTGFVEAGQAAQIQFQTFEFTKFGDASGSVRVVSADSFLVGGTAGTTGTPSNEAGNSVFNGVNPTNPYFYDVRVSIDRLNLKNVPRNFHLTPGLPVSVNIKVGDRTVLDYLVARVLPIIYEGMREPD
jgi:hemolysin D